MSQYSEYINHYNQYKDKIYSFFYYRLGNEGSLAEDLTSDTFLKAFEHYDNYETSFAFSTWIYTIARNTLIDFYRKNKVPESIEHMEESGVEIEDKDTKTVEEQIETIMSAEQVKEILDTLPPLQKECIILKYLEEQDTKDIAQITNMNEANVRKAISRGMKLLKQKSVMLYTLLIIFSQILS